MGRINTLISSWLLASLAVIGEAHSPETESKIEVHVYNYASLSPGMLTGTEHETAGIFQRMGIKIEWRNCPRSAEELARNTTCDLPGAPTRFILRLLSTEMAQRLPLRSEVFGFAALPLDGGFGVVVDVFADRVAEMARAEESRVVILGHLVAHEMGHLLLRTATHSVAGIMRAQWCSQDLERVREHRMFFLTEQEGTIREQVWARTLSNSDPPASHPFVPPR